MPSAECMFLTQLACTLFLTGLIWTVQVVNYPLFAAVWPEGFDRYHRGHLRRITAVVAVPMLLELATSFLLPFYRPPFVPPAAAWAGLGLTALVWLSTVFLQVPRHQCLSRGYQAADQAALTAGNWLRTAAWTLRSVLLLFLLYRVLPAAA